MLVSLGPIDVMSLPAERRAALLGVARSFGYTGGYAGLGSWLSSFINRNKNTISSLGPIATIAANAIPIPGVSQAVSAAVGTVTAAAQAKVQEAEAQRQLQLVQQQPEQQPVQTVVTEQPGMSPWVIGGAILLGVLALRGR